MVAAGHRASMNLSVQHKNGVSQICVSHLKWAFHSLRIASLIGPGGTPISSLHPNVQRQRECVGGLIIVLCETKVSLVSL